MKISSGDFQDSGVLSTQFALGGDNVSPALSWTGAPGNTRSFIIIVDDPDAPRGTWTHWLMFDIPSSVTSLEHCGLNL